jgi:hypothetical protein
MTTIEPARLSLVRPGSDNVNLAIVAASLPDDPEARIHSTWALVVTRGWWGPVGPDPGGDPVVIEAGGVTARFAGRPIPCSIVGDLVHLGLPSRLGNCITWALTACERLLQRDALNVHLVLGRSGGDCRQTWAESQTPAGRWLVSDLTLDDVFPFQRDDFMRAIHGTVGSRFPVPDVDALDEYREAIESGTLEGAIRLRQQRLSAGITRREGD